MAVLATSTLDLYCWTGKWSEQPSTAQYSITKSNPDSNNTIRFEIGELIQDYVDIVFDNDYGLSSSQISNAKTTCWWRYEKTNTHSDGSPDTFEVVYGIGTKGYSYFEDGINSSLTTSKMISNDYIYIPENETIRIPIYIGPGGVTNVKFYNVDSSGNEVIVDTKSYSLYNQAPLGPEDSNNYIRYASSGVTSTKVEVISANTSLSTYSSTTSSGTETLYVKYLDCSKYNNYKVSFVNKLGAIQDLWFNKKRTDKFEIERDSFSTSTITSTTSSVSYNLYDPSTVVQDVSSKKSIILNTSFVKEEYNEVIRQLLSSEDIWIVEDNKTIPILVKDSNFTYRTHLNDKLVNYTIEFEYAFSGINTIR